MKKLVTFLFTFAVVLTLTACGSEKSLPETINMDNVDQYLNREDVQYVDLRNWQDKMAAGYIEGFEMIPFFDYLENTVLQRTNSWDYSDADLLDGGETRIKQIFDEDKAIFVMCASGTRAGYVKAVLDDLGYENVYNIGGLGQYSGDHKVLGDGSYNTLNTLTKGDYTPGVYYGYDETQKYIAVVTVAAGGKIESVLLDALSCSDTDGDGIKETCNNTKQGLGVAGYPMNMVDEDGTLVNKVVEDADGNERTLLNWHEQANKLATAIVGSQGWSTDWQDAETLPDDIAGVTMGIDGFKVAIENALAKAAK